MEFLKERSAFWSVAGSKERVKLLNNKIERAKEKIKLSIVTYGMKLSLTGYKLSRSNFFEFVRIEFIGV